MSDWKYTFDTVTKDAWLKQIESDLRQGGNNSIESEWWPGEKLIPTLHAEDRQLSIRLPDSLFQQPPRIMEWIDTSADDPKTINLKILDALNYGVQSLVLQIDPEKKMPFRLWLDSVFDNMIELSVSLDVASPEIINIVREIVPDNTLIRLKRKSNQLSSVYLEALQGTLEENAKSFRFVYEFPSGENWTAEASGIFQLVLNDLMYWTSQGFNQIDFLENCIILFVPDTQFARQLIQTRVLHIVWNNLWKQYTNAHGISSSPYLEIHLYPTDSADPNHSLIRSSVAALAASLTGVHSLCIYHIPGRTLPNYYSRIDRNIHHLLNMESEMYKGTDPLAGSYTLDCYTQRWTEDIWSKLLV
ncbi:MAG: methylmalonyl-CoA mutase family protein [Saprospiraceae bacterium]